MLKSLKHFLLLHQMDKQEVLDFFTKVDQMRHPRRTYPNKTVVHFYHEPARSLYAFQAASYRLGCNVMTIEPSQETLEDTVKTIQHYGDALVIRHPDPESHRRAMAVSRIPVIQAGVHGQTTQALTDIYTIYKELLYRGIELDSLNRKVIHITFLGYGRHTQSLVKYLEQFPKIVCHYATELSAPEVVDTDILYVFPIQKNEDKCVNKEFLSTAKPTLILMHALPRQEEMLAEVDTNPRSVYFHQSENGIYVRMAQLDQILSVRYCPTFTECIWIFLSAICSFRLFK